MDGPEEYADRRISLKDEFRYLALLPTNSIPTTFDEKSEYPVLVVGENAKYVTDEDLRNGAIIDFRAAEILNKRGYDTGLISAKPATVDSEKCHRHDDFVDRVNTGDMYEMTVKDGAEIISSFVPNNTPASYICGKFMVMGVDLTQAYEKKDICSHNFFFNYYRQDDLIYAIEKLGGKKLPVVSRKNPMLYTLASKDDESMSVILSNIFEDDVFEGVFELDKEYKSIRFINCTGKLLGDKVIIDKIHPFSMAAFEVR